MSHGALVVAAKDIRNMLSSFRFYISILVSGAIILFFWAVGFMAPTGLPGFFRILSTLSLPCLGAAMLFLTADLISREREKGTITILLIQPISDFSIMLGKFMVMIFCAIIFAVSNVLLLASYYYGIGEMLSTHVLLPIFLSFVLFQLALSGLTLPLSTIIKRSILVPFTVIITHFTLVALYSYLTVSTMTVNPNAPPHVTAPLTYIFSTFFIFFVLAMGTAGLEFLLVMKQTLGPWVTISEPEVIKYVPINVDAQRIFYYLLGVDRGLVGFTDAFMSGLALIAISLLGVFLSVKILRRVSAEA